MFIIIIISLASLAPLPPFAYTFAITTLSICSLLVVLQYLIIFYLPPATTQLTTPPTAPPITPTTLPPNTSEPGNLKKAVYMLSVECAHD